MVLFGTNPINKNSSQYAIKVGDISISHDEFYKTRQEIEQSLQQRLGANYYQLLDAGLFNLNQQTIDTLLEQLLLNKFALDLGTGVGNSELTNYIRSRFSPDGKFDMNLYANFLASQQMTAPQFETRIRGILLASSVENIIQDASVATKLEAEANRKKDLTAYDVAYLEINPESFKTQAKDFAEDELLKYYEENSLNFEQPAKIKYQYVTFTPEDAKDKVEVLDEDIELYYLEHQTQFQEPAKYSASHIQINYTNDSSPEKVKEIKQLAEELHNRIQTGESIADLALEYSDDIATKSLGGSLGTFAAGTHSPEIEKTVFAMTEPGLAPLLETDYGFEIIAVDEIIQPDAKPIEDVKDKIKAELIERDAPAYARVQAEEFFDAAQSANFNEIAKTQNLEVKETKDLLNEQEDPDESLSGLTKMTLEVAGDMIQIHDLGDKTLVINVLDYQEANIPEFQTVKKDIQEFKATQKSNELAKLKSEEIISLVTDEKTLKEVANDQKLSVKEVKNLKEVKIVLISFQILSLEKLYFRHKRNCKYIRAQYLPMVNTMFFKPLKSLCQITLITKKMMGKITLKDISVNKPRSLQS